MREEGAHTPPAACLPSVPRQREVPAAARKFELPLSRFPSGGKPGRAGSPHAAGTLCASKKRWHTSMPRLPPQEGFTPLKPPLAHPPDGHRWGCAQMVELDLPDRAGEIIKDGRHVGLDFYGLLIEGDFSLMWILPGYRRSWRKKEKNQASPSYQLYCAIEIAIPGWLNAPLTCMATPSSGGNTNAGSVLAKTTAGIGTYTVI